MSENEKGILTYTSDKTQAIFMLINKQRNVDTFTFSLKMEPHVDCPESIIPMSESSLNEIELYYREDTW